MTFLFDVFKIFICIPDPRWRLFRDLRDVRGHPHSPAVNRHDDDAQCVHPRDARARGRGHARGRGPGMFQFSASS